MQTENTIILLFAGGVPVETGFGIMSKFEQTTDPSVIPATFSGHYSEISNNGRVIENGEASFAYDAGAGTLEVSGPSSLNGKTFNWNGNEGAFELSTKNVKAGASILGDSELFGTYANSKELLGGVFGGEF